MPQLTITFDGGKIETTNIDAVFGWREWSQFDDAAIKLVASGVLRRFSTDRDGVPCDIELRKTNEI